jgi:hypothetical protein
MYLYGVLILQHVLCWTPHLLGFTVPLELVSGWFGLRSLRWRKERSSLNIMGA